MGAPSTYDAKPEPTATEPAAPPATEPVTQPDAGYPGDPVGERGPEGPVGVPAEN